MLVILVPASLEQMFYHPRQIHIQVFGHRHKRLLAVFQLEASTEAVFAPMVKDPYHVW